MAITYTTKLGLSLAGSLGDAAGTWHTLWNADHNALEARLAATYAGDPNGNVAGYWIGQHCYDTSNHVVYTCTTTGDAATAVWQRKLQSYDANTAKLNVEQSWDADTAQKLDGTKDIGSLDALASDTHTIEVGAVAELDADVDGTIAAPTSGYGFSVLHIYNNGTRSLTLSGFPTAALNGGELAGTDTKIDVLVVERASVNGSAVVNHWIYNRA